MLNGLVNSALVDLLLDHQRILRSWMCWRIFVR